MTLARQLMLGSLLIVATMVLVVVAIIDRRVGARLSDETTAALVREARLVSQHWTAGVDADSLADRLGAAVGHRVTLIDASGEVLGDSEFDGPALVGLENHSGRPEVQAAKSLPFGSARRASASAGDEELYVAVAAPLGTVRVSLSMSVVNEIIARARRDVVLAALAAMLLATALVVPLARGVSRPITELRDGANRLAAGDLTHRFALVGPGEIGDLASALRRMADELSARIGALEAEDTLMLALIESLNEGVVAFDKRGRALRINGSARRLLGLVQELPFDSDQLPRDRVLREALSSALNGKDSEPKETSIGEKALVVTASPLRDGGAVLTLFDLTPLRRLELVRRDFVANASHELKTPLTVISGFAETLAEEDVPDVQRRQFISAIRSNAHRMQRLVDDLLDLSRIESGGWMPKPQRVNIREIAQELMEPSRLSTLKQGVSPELAIEADAQVVRADPTAVRQILANLIDNAARHTESGFVRIFTRRDHEGFWLGVQDSGSGIGAQHLPRIFERFYRADSARAREGGGTGLGLAIVRHLAEAHGGRVHAQSTPGTGTTIAVVLPAGDLPGGDPA